jgi:hypothetical protein
MLYHHVYGPPAGMNWIGKFETEAAAMNHIKEHAARFGHDKLDYHIKMMP